MKREAGIRGTWSQDRECLEQKGEAGRGRKEPPGEIPEGI